MRTSLFAVLMFGASVTGFAADGTVYFNNRVPGVVLAPIYAPVPGATAVTRQGNAAATGNALIDPFPAGLTDYLGAARLGGTAYTAELWSFDGAMWNPVPGSQRNFRTGAAVGFIEIPAAGADVTIPGVNPGDTASLLVRAWDNVGGTISDYNLATTRGESATFSVVLGGTPAIGPAIATPNMDDLRSFSLATTVVDPCNPDLTPPVVTLIGLDPLIVECGTIFADPSATATDGCDGSLAVVPSGAVNSSIPGNYVITYSATDAAGNTGSATRTVTIADTTAPVITLNGAARTTIECGSAFVDPGATALDACVGSVAVSTSGAVSTGVPGTYVLTYTATDPSGNSANATRTVVIADTAAPVITLNGANPLTIECGTPFVDPGATALDACAGPVAVSTSGAVDSSAPGSYVLTYTATDPSGNTAAATRTVNVVDTTAPVVTLNGADRLTVSCTFADPGATALDSCQGPLPVIVSGTVDINTPGTYVLTYTATDSSGNTGSTPRTVTVDPCPDCTLTCPASIRVVLPDGVCSTTVTFSDPVPSTACVGPFSIVCVPPSGSTFAAGVTTVTCSVTDSRGVIRTCTFTVTVVDEQPPVITCPPDLTVNCLDDVPLPDFADGTVSDNCDATPSITHVGDVTSGTDPTIITRTYEARDASGNTSTCDQIITIQALAGDLNADCCVDRDDLDLLLVQVRARSTDLTYDLNGDGVVNIADARTLVLLFSNPGGGPCPIK